MNVLVASFRAIRMDRDTILQTSKKTKAKNPGTYDL